MWTPNLFDAAVERWLKADAPVAEFKARPYQTGTPGKISPSRMGDCPTAHAFHKAGVAQTNPEQRQLSDELRLMQGHLTQWKWYNILQYAPVEDLKIAYEVPYETALASGHIDILLELPLGGHPQLVPVEVKNTHLRLAERYFWQAATYATAFGECILVLDRDAGEYDLVSVRETRPGQWRAIDLRHGWEFTNRKNTYQLTTTEITDRIQNIVNRLAIGLNPRSYASPKLKQCLFKNGDWRPCPWFNHCWGEYRMVDGHADPPVVITGSGEHVITE